MNPFMGCMREMNINGLDLISSLRSNGRTAIYNNTGKDTSDYYIDRDCNAVSSKVFTAVIVTCGHKKITNKSIVIYWIGNCYHLCNVVFVGGIIGSNDTQACLDIVTERQIKTITLTEASGMWTILYFIYYQIITLYIICFTNCYWLNIHKFTIHWIAMSK